MRVGAPKQGRVDPAQLVSQIARSRGSEPPRRYYWDLWRPDLGALLIRRLASPVIDGGTGKPERPPPRRVDSTLVGEHSGQTEKENFH
jgi:hypothetical protein